MYNIPKYKSPVSLIPGGCLQFLDFAAETSRIGRLRRAFREERRPEGGDGRRRHVLHCLESDEDGGYRDMLTGAAAVPDYECDARKSVEIWFGQWLPVPFLRLRDQKWPDGGERYECGPSNWARARLTRSEETPDVLRLVIAFDVGVEEPAAEEAGSFALSPKDVAAHGAFRLARHVRDNAWFLNAGWVDEWLFAAWEKGRGKKRNDDPDIVLEYLAHYLTFLDVLCGITSDITVQVINPERDNPVDVDLVLDIGNSRTTGILVETLPQRITNLNDSYLLQLRDMGKPERVYAEPFETRVEFAEANFGNDALSRRSGRRTPAFTWPSAVRVGPEAARLSALAVCAEGSTGLSSPKRYLWDERPRQQSWRYNTGGGPEPMVTRGLFAKRVNEQGTPLACFDDPQFKRNPLLRRQEREAAFESHFTRSSLMLFMLGEVLLQALLTINSPGQRGRRELPNVPRRLRRILFTVPSGMPIAEQRIYRRWVGWAVRTLWEALGWQAFYLEPGGRNRSPRPDYRMSPTVRCDWDEATCTQLVYLYNELTCKFQGDAHHLFRLAGSRREEYGPRASVRVATIDIGGGTTDLSITAFELESEESDTARIRPHPEFRDGFNIAGDDVLREIVNNHVLPAIAEAAVSLGVPDGRSLLARLFGRDVMDNAQENRNRRAQFIRQVAVPVALSLLAAYEKADLLSGGGVEHGVFGDFFRSPALSGGSAAGIGPGDEEARQAALHPLPGETVIGYVEEAVNRLLPEPDFRLMAVPVRIDPCGIDRTIRETMARPLANLCEVIRLYDCDMLLLTGRPSRWDGIIASVFARLPVPPDRIVPMCRFRTGSWYPFADALGNITDPKTTVVVGAILCALAEGHLEGFSFDTSRLKLKSTARFIGEMDINGQIRRPKVWFAVDVDNPAPAEQFREVLFAGPIAVGFRQLEAERWTTTRFHLMDFSGEEARRRASGKLPYTVTLRLALADPEEHPEQERDEGELFLEDIRDKNGDAVNPHDLEVRLQTLPLDEGYWLDTGIVYQAG